MGRGDVKLALLLGAALVRTPQTALEPSFERTLGALGASLLLYTAALACPRGIGMRHVKLALLRGAALGRTVPGALMIGMGAASVPAVILLGRHGSAARK